MRLPVLSCLLLASLFCATCVRAQDGMRWMCWLGSLDDYNIHCLREADPVLEDVAKIPEEPYNDDRMRSEFHSTGKSRNVARVVREAPRRYQDIVWSIPLYSMPFDIRDVELLAQAMMCGTDARCEVVFTRNEQQVAGH